MTELSIVVPLYGCRPTLEQLVEELTASCSSVTSEFEIILVDDRGPDKPWDLMLEIAKRNNHVRCVRLARNFGQHPAIWAGLNTSKGRWVVVMDGDLQDDPSFVAELFRRARSGGNDYLIVERGTWSDSKFRRVSSAAFYSVFSYLAGVKLSSRWGNFGIYSRQVIDAVLSIREQNVFFPAAVAWVGFDSEHVLLDRDERMQGESAYNLNKMLILAAKTIVAFSNRPLRISIHLGLAVSALSAVVALLLLLVGLLGGTAIEGWTSIMLSIWFFSGLIVANLGLLGIYLGRVFAEVKNRPVYIVSEDVGTVRADV